MFSAEKFFPLYPEQVAVAWPQLLPLVEFFVRKTCMVSAQEIARQLASGDCQLWCYHDGDFRGICVTRIYADAIGKVCELWACVGMEIDEVIDGSVSQLERWAADVGCYKTRIIGRLGWERRLTGYQRTAIVLDKQLSEMH